MTINEPILINLAEKLELTRYNGGWTKTVTGLDKTKNNGYSITGNFVNEGVQPLQHGLFLLCDVSGSRKNQVKHYYLVALRADGSVDTLAEVTGTSGYDRGKSGHDWAVRLWEDIDAYFAAEAAKTEPATLSEALASAAQTNPEAENKERLNCFKQFPLLSEISSAVDLANLIDVVLHQARIEADPDEEVSAQICNEIFDVKQALLSINEKLNKPATR